MENSVILREWFDRVDSEKTGSITAIQLKVQQAFSDLERNRGFLATDDVHEALNKIGFSLDSPAFYTACELPTVEYEVDYTSQTQLQSSVYLCIFG
ncbi:hypothetical protein CCACVL1_10070 [Corchorus capsularis]|uniref:EF-hand domain-containing protein n=1 Tax=Corchorus capsularis TaxID=210143 RepID=A0A1R3ISS5_COCAP|nr:hypothetical protein CCACVL1_10070 [Corchorus capsularis]